MDDDEFEKLVKEQYEKRILEDSQRLTGILAAKFRKLNITIHNSRKNIGNYSTIHVKNT